MKYLKFTHYLYLFIGAAFFYEAVTKWNDPEATPNISLLIGGMAVFMFFFRRNFAKKAEDRNSKL